MMKTVRCIIGPEHLPAFVEQMGKAVPGMTVAETRQHGSDSLQKISYRGVEYEVGSLSVAVEMVVDESWVDDIIRQIADAHRQERFSVRRVYVIPVEFSYHIRSGFMDM